MLALAFDLLWTDHSLARDATLTRSGAEPRDQHFSGGSWPLSSFSLIIVRMRSRSTIPLREPDFCVC